jgi:hypothetical protein
LPVTPTARWHPGFSSVVESGGRVVSASDLQGLAAATEGGAGLGPLALTDALGRKFWRFDGAQFMNVANALTINNRAVSVFMVGRAHRGATGAILGFGNAAAGTAINAGGAAMDSARALLGAPYLRSHSRAGALDATNGRWMVPGAQMQVLGAASRTTANGGTCLMLNRKQALVAQNTVSAPSVIGAEIARRPDTPGTSGNWGTFDLYELIVWSAGLTNAQMQNVASTLADHYAIPEIENQLILDGDSIMQGTGDVTASLSAAMIATEIGANRIPATWRVVNMGTSGNQVSNLVGKRDDATSWSVATLPGQNVLAFEIGRNDMGSGGLTATQHYANVLAYMNTPTTGVLQRGWHARVMANIATSSILMAQIEAYRALIRNPQFLTDTQSAPGMAFAGRVSVVDTDLIEDGGQPIFLTAANATDTTYYAGDNTHPTILGARLRITGGDNPARGVAWGL